MPTNHITLHGEYAFDIGQHIIYQGDTWEVKHRYTERFERNKVPAIPRYVVWDKISNQLITVSEVAIKPVG